MTLTTSSVRPPLAKLVPKNRQVHGQSWVDNYEWLRNKDDAEVLAHLNAENDYTTDQTEHLADLREQIFNEIKSRTVETDLSVPVRRGSYWYYARTFADLEYGTICRTPVADESDFHPPMPNQASVDQPALPGEEVLLNLDTMATGHEFFELGGWSVSPDERLLLFAVDVVGDERYVVRVKDLRTDQLLAEEISNARGSGVWHPDSTSFYYTTVDDAWRSDKVWCHQLGTAPSEDALIHHETDERFFTGVGKTRSGRFLMVASGSKVTTDYLVYDTQQPELGWWQICARREGLEYHLEHAVIGGSDEFLVLHNHRSPDSEISRISIAPHEPDLWSTWLPPTPGTTYTDVNAFASHIVVSQRSAGLTQLRVVELAETGPTDNYLMEFPDELYTVGISANPMFAQPNIRFGYTTLAKPAAIYDYSPLDRGWQLLKQAPVLGGYDASAYSEHRVWATAPDGTEVPISLIVPKTAQLPIPVQLYGYGAYEISIDPYFSVARLSLLDRGAGFAIAHVRGGGELGRDWYEQGKFGFKQNTFTDFVASAQALVDQGWTTPTGLVAEGGSAGGLLIGAVANQAPELFAGLVAEVPFVDTLTTMLDPSLPLTVPEYEEWGNPTDAQEIFEHIRAYAPYENVASQTYPPILVETSLHDTRVLYVEAAKWVAKIRAHNHGAPHVLLRTQMSAGHGGVSGRYQSWRERAFTLAWILDRMGMATQKAMKTP